MFKKLICFSILGITCLGAVAKAEIAIITHPSVSLTANKSDISALFLGKSKNIAGNKLTPIDQEEGSASKDSFYQKLSNKNPSQLNAYWARIVFTGKGQPPKALMDDDEVKDFVANNSDAIGYIESNNVDTSVKVVLTVK